MRKLLTTTALAAVLAVPGFAVSGAAAAAGTGQTVSVVTVTTTVKANASGYLASGLMGSEVYESSAKDAKSIGDIEDLLLSEDGQAQAVIIGVGGFLGVGEKQVAVDFSRLKMEKDGDGGLRVVSALTKAELEAAAAYEKHSMSDTVSKTVNQASAAVAAAATATAAAVKDTVSDRKAFHDGKTKVAMDSVAHDKLVGTRVHDRDGNDVGEISKIVLTGEGRPDAAVIDVGGFLGIGEKQVALGYDSLAVYSDSSGTLYVATPYTEEELETAVEFDAKAYESDRARILLMPRKG